MTDLSDFFLFKEVSVAIDKCMGFAHFANPGELALCIGPSGAGKTSLSRLIGERVYGAPARWREGTIPYIWVSADNPVRGYFSPRELTRSMLVALRDPFRALSVEAVQWNLEAALSQQIADSMALLPRKQSSEPEMRQVIANVGRQRSLRLIIIDEANMLSLTYLNRVPTDYLESLRTLGKKSGARVLLFGTYDMLELMGCSAQLNRSTLHIHLDRMRCEDKRGRTEFVGMLAALEAKWTIRSGLMTSHAQELHDWTYGIPGEIDSLIRRAMMNANRPGSSLSWDQLANGRASPAEIMRMRMEADGIYAVLNNEALSKEHAASLKRRRRSGIKARRRTQQGY